MLSRLGAMLQRWQEFFGWAPLIVIVALVGWVVLGALDPRLGPDRIGLLLDLPILAAYLAVASGGTYLIWRRWSRRLTQEENDALWHGVIAGKRGPLIVYGVNAAFYLLTLVLVLFLLWPAR